MNKRRNYLSPPDDFGPESFFAEPLDDEPEESPPPEPDLSAAALFLYESLR